MSEPNENESKDSFQAPSFKKRLLKSSAQRKRVRLEEDGDNGESKLVSDFICGRKKKDAKVNVFHSGDGTRKRFENDENEKFTTATLIESTRDALPVRTRGGATDLNETETSIEHDARAIMERSIELQNEEDPGVKVYRGQSGYKQHIAKTKEQIGSNKHTGLQGPIRAPQYTRTTSVFDYQPDICKDYKETGCCGFGDSCKFLHDRGDYKAGWQLEQEWNNKQKLKKQKEERAFKKFESKHFGDEHENEPSDEDDKYAVKDDDDQLPFACYICRQGFKDPIVTNCNHYFCEQCAIESYRESSRCVVCGKETGGVFNYAKRLIEFMTKKGMLKNAEVNDGVENYEVKDELELTSQNFSKKSQGSWETVSE